MKKMKQFFFPIALFMTCILYGQSKDEQAIGQLLTSYEEAAKSGDYQKIADIYADSLVFIANDGKMYTKAERVEHMKATPHPDVFAFESRRIRVYGNTAIVNTDLRMKASGREEETHVTTLVLVKQNSKWKVVNIQGTRRVTNK